MPLLLDKVFLEDVLPGLQLGAQARPARDRVGSTGEFFMTKNVANTAIDTTRECTPIKVAMHVLGAAATDPRVLREATALIEAGYAVSIVDIEEEGTHSLKKSFEESLLKHVLMPRAFFSSRFDKWALFRVTKMFLFARRDACYKFRLIFIMVMRYQDYRHVMLRRVCVVSLSFLMHMKCLYLSDLYQSLGQAAFSP